MNEIFEFSRQKSNGLISVLGSKLKYFINFTCDNGQKMTAYFSVFCESAKFCFRKKVQKNILLKKKFKYLLTTHPTKA